MRQKKALIVNPYWDTMGGGERYSATVASVLLKSHWCVDIIGEEKIQQAIKSRFAIDLSDAKFVSSDVYTAHYDLVFWLSDGSIPLSFAKKTILHFQFPFSELKKPSVLTKAKLHLYSVVCNSQFTKKCIDKQFGISSQVLYPPIDTNSFIPTKKTRSILYVGRFSQLTQKKNPHLLLEAFSQLKTKNIELILAGGVGVGSKNEYFDKVKQDAKLQKIRILENPSINELKKLYGQACIFWSASGMGVNESLHPTQVEHFGMSVVEAMSAGCIPVVSNSGGHTEIVQNDQNGFLVQTPEQMAAVTDEIVASPNKLRELSQSAQRRSQDFSLHEFSQKLLQLVS